MCFYCVANVLLQTILAFFFHLASDMAELEVLSHTHCYRERERGLFKEFKEFSFCAVITS